MPFPTTNYNLLAKVWNPGHTPAANAPDFTNQPCQLYADPHDVFWFSFANPGGATHFSGIASLCKFHPNTLTFAQRSIIQPDSTTAKYYIVLYDQQFFYGFPQWYHGAWVIPCAANGALIYNYAGA